MSQVLIVAEHPAAYVIDTGGDRPPVLCLHGWGASTDLFRPAVEGLHDRYRLVVPDFPGFGETPPPPVAWGVEDYAQWVVALLDRLELSRVDIIAHSFGARIAVRLATRHPARVGRLVLTGAAGVELGPGFSARLRTRWFKLRRSLSGAAWVPVAARRRLQASVADSGSRDYRAAQGVMRPTFVRIVTEDLRPEMPSVAVPTLLVWGDRDEEVGLELAHIMEKLIPDCGLVVFEGGSHYAYIEQSARFCRIVDTFFGAADAD